MLTNDKGEKVYDADNPITVTVTGEAKLLGIENSDANDVSDYHATTRKAKHGNLIIYVQPQVKSDGGSYTIKLESLGMEPVSIRTIREDSVPDKR